MLSIVASFVFWLFWLGFFTITWSHVLVKETSGWFSSCLNCWGDWSAHLSYVTSFAYGDNFPAQLPIMAGHKFSYPFVVDLLSAILVKLGLDLRLALIIPGWILSLVLIWLIVKLGQKLTAKKTVGVLASFLFLFNGGGKFLNIVISRLVPQRGWLLGMSLAIIIYLCFWQWLKKPQKKSLLTAGVIAGLLPLIHFHSFMVVNFIAAWFLVFRFSWQWLYFFLAMALLAAGQIFGFYGQPLGFNLIRFKLGWLAGQQNLVIFWLINLGLILFLGILGLIKAKKNIKNFVLPFWGLFILGNLFIFQPFDWDNTKIFDHWYLILAILAAIALEKMFSDKRCWLKVGASLLFILSILPGFFETVKFNQYQKNKYLFFSNEQLVLAEATKKIIEPQAVVLTAGNHNHWLPALTGRKIVLGYTAWLWSYGIDYHEREADVKKIYQTANKSLLDKYKIDYVLIGSDERKQFEVNEDFFDKNFPIVLDSEATKVYQVY